jgi:hypothetical protein
LLSWACGGGRNTFGNPKDETLQSECTLVGGTRVRWYEGNAGATVSFWYSVTAEPPGGDEKQLFYTYAYPSIVSVACEGDRVVATLEGAPAESWLEPEAVAQSRSGARGYYRGAAQRPPESPSP